MALDRAQRPNVDVASSHGHPLEIAVGADGSATVLTVAGELDMSTVPPLQASLDRCAQGANGPIVIDLAAVTFLDSSGLAVIVRAHESLKGPERGLVVRNPSAMVQRVFELADLVSIVTVEHDVEAGG